MMATKTYTHVLARSIILLSAIMAFAHSSHSQDVFLKTFGGKHNDEMHNMVRSHDGGFVMAGNTESYGQGNFGNTDGYVVKTDSNGNTLWSTTLGYLEYDDIFWIEPASDSGYLLCGVASDNDTSIGMLLAKISESGSVLWQKVLEKHNGGFGYCIRQTTDGGSIVAGEVLLNDNIDFLLLKIDADGNIQWARQIGSSEPDIPSFVMQTKDGGYLICGDTRQNSATLPAYVVKTDSTGNVEWQKTYNTSPPFSRSNVVDAIATKDGGYLLAGSNTHNQLYADVMLLKIDSAGDPQWTGAYGGYSDEYGGSIIQNSDGNYVVCGASASSETDNFDALVMVIDTLGNLVESSLFGTADADDEFQSVLQLADGGYMLGGNSSSFSQFHYSDYMMLRLNKDFEGPQCDQPVSNIFESTFFLTDTSDYSEFDLTVSENNVSAAIDSGVQDSLLCQVATGEENPPPANNGLGCYPNPATSDLTLYGNYAGAARMEFYNSLGLKISSIPFSQSVNVHDLAGGYYLIRFVNDEGGVLKTLRFVKQ